MAEATAHTCDHESMLSVMKFMTERSPEELCDDESDIMTQQFIHNIFPGTDYSKCTLEKLQAAIWILKKAEKDISNCIRKNVKRLQKEIYTRKGIGSLPDEVLMRIFELAWDLCTFEKSLNPIDGCNRPNALGTTLASVDRRFRRISLSTPALWSIVASNQPIEERATSLARSKAVGIHVYFVEDREGGHVYDSEPLIQIVAHSQRWESLFIARTWAPFLRIENMIRQPLKLPSLRSLYVERLPDSDELPGSYAKWYMPKLESLYLRDMVLTPSFAPSLVRCEIEFELGFEYHFYDHNNNPINIYNCFNGLGAFCQLETLKLVGYPFHLMDIPDTIVALSLPKLTLLQLETDYCTGHQLAVILDTPHLQRDEITFSYWRDEDHNIALEGFLPTNARKYTSLRELSFHFFDIGFYDGDFLLNQIDSMLEQLPSVEHLTVLIGDWLTMWNFEKNQINLQVRTFCSNGRDVRDALSTLTDLSDVKGNMKLEVVRRKANNDYAVVLREKHFEKVNLVCTDTDL